MNSVTLLPNGVKCITKKSDALPEGSMTYGAGDEQHYDSTGNIIKDFKGLPKYSEKLLKLGPLEADLESS
jgi:hypothetical protein